jgi:hypothetical protein
LLVYWEFDILYGVPPTRRRRRRAGRGVRHDVILPTRRPGAARLAVRPEHILGTREAHCWYHRPEVRAIGALEDDTRRESRVRVEKTVCSLCNGDYRAPLSYINITWALGALCGNPDYGLVSDDLWPSRTLLVGKTGLEQAKKIVTSYKQGKTQELTPELWKAKRIVDSTLHPDTGQPVFLPFRMSCFALSNLVVTAGMLTPGLGVCLVALGSRVQLGRLADLSLDYRHHPLADCQPVYERRNQQRERQQVLAVIN